MKKIIVFGAGGHAQSLIDVINCHPSWKVDRLVGKKNDLGKSCGDYLVEIDENDLDKNYFYQAKYALIGIGHIGLDMRRKNLLVDNTEISPH